jgi:hypothetical protein
VVSMVHDISVAGNMALSASLFRIRMIHLEEKKGGKYFNKFVFPFIFLFFFLL